MKRTQRPGFTLLELLAVISIIVVLLGLSVGAYYRVRISQEESATRTTITKLQTQLEAQMRNVLDNCRDDQKNSRVPAAVVGLANDNRRALVIWTKIKLKHEFPQNFHEALVWPQQMYANGYGIQVKPSFRTAFPTGYVPGDPAALANDRLFLESAVLFYLSVIQSRRGNVGFDPQQHIGAHGISEVSFPDLPGLTFKVFRDSWDQPIGFIRWPLGGGNSELNSPPFQQYDNAGRVIDPQDPERTLQGNDWVTTPLATQFVNVLGHPLTVPPLNPLNLAPVIISAGRDKRLGISMQPAFAFAYVDSGEDDNIYGYRMKGEGRRE